MSTIVEAPPLQGNKLEGRSVTMADWFQTLTGLRETDIAGPMADQFLIDGDFITSKGNGRRMRAGTFETPSLAELRLRVGRLGHDQPAGPIRVREHIGDAEALHLDSNNVGALVQAASQFNALEMPGPSVTPEDGIGGYEHDHTQGPACAIACGAGTIWRNYLTERPDGTRGQRVDSQVDCLHDLVSACGTSFTMKNGYALPTLEQIQQANSHIATLTDRGREALGDRLRIALMHHTEVTSPGMPQPGHVVTQAYCSALPLGYSSHSQADWEPLARLVLNATYDATLSAARINAAVTGNPNTYLTMVGGGVFQNPISWIVDAIERALSRHQGSGLHVALVSFRRSNPAIRHLLTSQS